MALSQSVVDRRERWQPLTVTSRVRTIAWWVFATQVLIVATGGAVRLTGSGLGCDTWPKCTADSFVHNPEMGIHSYIEFGNRTLTILLEIIAILALYTVWRMRRNRKDLFWLTLMPVLSVFLQAVVGGITVLSGLNPYVVGLHFLLSAAMVVLSVLLLVRVYSPEGKRVNESGVILTQIAWLSVIFGTVAVLLGVLTTGSGPHAGDGGAARNNLDSGALQAVHTASAYGTLAFTIVTRFLANAKRNYRMRTFASLSILLLLLQIPVGIAQARLSLPPILVGTHMVLACLLISALVIMLLEAWQPQKKAVTTGT